LKELVEGKNVLHIGCADHLELIENKIKNSDWLHGILSESSNVCLGIDTDEKAIGYLKSIGIKNVLCKDISQNFIDEIAKGSWDYIVLADVLEHLDDPISFLSSIYNNYMKYIDKMVITVPNAFRWLNFRKALKNIEGINSDHRYWFTPYTLIKLSYLSNYKLEKIYMVDPVFGMYRLKDKMRNLYRLLFLKHKPLFCESIVVILTK
jgi:hypothetical protein